MTNPRLVYKTQPIFPEQALEARVSGRLTLQALITKNGEVAGVHVLRAEPPEMGFEEAAMESVTQWRYEPALADGRPTDVLFTVYVEYKVH